MKELNNVIALWLKLKDIAKTHVTRVAIMCHYLRIKHDVVVIVELAKRKLSMSYKGVWNI